MVLEAPRAGKGADPAPIGPLLEILLRRLVGRLSSETVADIAAGMARSEDLRP